MRLHFLIYFVFFLLYANSSTAQMKDPVKWSTDVKPLGNNEFQIDFNAKIDDGWFLYAQELEPGGPLPSKFDFSQNGDVKLLGKIKEIGKVKEGVDPIFETFVRKYSGKVTFQAKVKSSKPKLDLKIPLMYMSCNDESCVKLDEEFSVSLVNKAADKPTVAPKPTVSPKKVAPPPPAPKVAPKPAPSSQPAPTTQPNQSGRAKSSSTSTTVKKTVPSRPNRKTVQQPSINTQKTTSSSASNIRPYSNNASKQEKKANAIQAQSASKSTKSQNSSKPALAEKSPSNSSKSNIASTTTQKATAATSTKNQKQASTTSGGKTTSNAAVADNGKGKKKQAEDNIPAVSHLPKDSTVHFNPPANRRKPFAKNKEEQDIAKIVSKSTEGTALADGSASDEGATADANDADLYDANAFADPAGGAGGFHEPVTWVFDHQALGNNEYLLKFTAQLQDGWYIYSQHLDEGGPLPTSINLNPNGDLELVDKTPKEISSHKKSGYDPIFEMEVQKFAKEVVFQQKVRLKKPGGTIGGHVRFMTCDDEKCLPPTNEDFEFSLGKVVSADQSGAAKNNSSDEKDASTPWGIFFGGLLGGFLALLTPCVFPMIPLTVSYFTKSSSSKAKGISNAIVYGLSIIAIYVGFGLLLTSVFGHEVFNQMATNPWINIAFFIIFLVFAFSFFGYYEISLPSWLMNKSAEAEERGGYLGIFFMATTLALVSFSCTGPIVGTLLVEGAVHGKTTGLVLGMLGFSLALAIPFALFAAFPGWLNSLPRSGGWLNTVKVVLGFIELALAFKFLSNADLVEQWGLIMRETFLVLWIIPIVLAGIYLLGLIKFPHDSPIKKLHPIRIGLATLFFGFAAYLGSGLFGGNLSLISGFPPPEFYSYKAGWSGASHLADGSHGEESAHCPLDLPCVHDLDTGMDIAKKEGKPIFIDFTGWACVNCRKMEENVWPEDGVIEKLKNDYVVVSLYVDERLDLPEKERIQYTDYRGREKTLKTVGDKWMKLQAECYGTNAQPYYVLLTPDGDMLKKKPIGYTPNKDKFKAYLDSGIENFKKGITEAKPLCMKE